MNFVFLMDPLDQVKMEKDTSFILMLASHLRGHKIYYLPQGGMFSACGQIGFHVQHVIPEDNKERPFLLHDHCVLTADQVDALFIRTDPPFNEQYLFDTWMCDLLKTKTFVMNNPNGIRCVNEKLWATQFVDLVPPTYVGRNSADLLSFLMEYETVIAKPTNGFGGQGVFKIKQGDDNTNVIFEALTQNGCCDIIVQQYIPEAHQGDKRILLLNGDPLGAVLRVHGDDDHRNNFFSGGKPAATTITARDQEIIDVLKPHLQRLGLYFVGIDIIGDYLIEVNVTSPTCLQEMNRLNEASLEENVIDFVEEQILIINR
ncbi:glutathione synthase [Candidatus Omnitrophota bacterium]